MKFFLAVFIGILIGGTTTFLFTNPIASENTSQAFSSELPEKNIDPTSELTQLREENNQLKIKLKSQSSEILHQQYSSQANACPSTPNNCDAQINKLMAFYAEKDKALAEIKDIKSAAQYDAKLHSDFNAENKNEIWSSTTENKILTELNKNDATRDIIVSTIDCRSSTCEIKIPAADIASKNKIMETLSDPNVVRKLGFVNSTIKSGLQLSGGEMTLYITDNN